MPKSNVQYPLEAKILEGIDKLSCDLFGTSSDISAFIIQLNHNGGILSTLNTAQHPDFNYWGDWGKDDSFKSSLFLDVVEQGEYIFIKWQNITQDRLEKLLDIKLSGNDFVSIINKHKTSFPITHDVMF